MTSTGATRRRCGRLPRSGSAETTRRRYALPRGWTIARRGSRGGLPALRAGGAPRDRRQAPPECGSAVPARGGSCDARNSLYRPWLLYKRQPLRSCRTPVWGTVGGAAPVENQRAPGADLPQAGYWGRIRRKSAAASRRIHLLCRTRESLDRHFVHRLELGLGQPVGLEAVGQVFLLLGDPLAERLHVDIGLARLAEDAVRAFLFLDVMLDLLLEHVHLGIEEFVVGAFVGFDLRDQQLGRVVLDIAFLELVFV